MRRTISISDIPWYEENNPEALVVLRVQVYDKEGTPTLIRAYELDRFLELGFLSTDGKMEELPTSIPEKLVEPTRHIVSSYRTRIAKVR